MTKVSKTLVFLSKGSNQIFTEKKDLRWDYGNEILARDKEVLEIKG